MNVKIYEEGPPITTDDISKLENKIGKKLPKQFKDFLLQHNGGSPFPSAFKIQWKGQQWANGYQVGLLDYFYSIDEEDDIADFYDSYGTFEDRIPANTLAIAHAEGGDLVLIGTEADNLDKIYFWAHSYETGDDDDPDFSNIGFVADDFNQLLERLYDDEA